MIKLRTLHLEALDLKDSSHRFIIRHFSDDGNTCKYISKKFPEFVKEPAESIKSEGEKVQVGKTYVVKDHDELIGCVGTKELDQNGYLELWLSIVPEFRNKNYGTKLLEEITPYLLEHIDRLEDIKLVINRNNYSSKRMAEKAGYLVKKEESIYDSDIYRYFGK